MKPSRPGSLRAGIEAVHGSAIKRTGLMKKVSTIQHPTHLRFLLQSYIDETRKTAPVVTTLAIDSPDYGNRVVQGLAPQRPGIDYVERPSGLKVFGFLSDVVLENGGDIDTLTDAEIIERLRDWWLASRQGHKKLAHHLVFSIDPRFAAELGERRVSVDDVLTASSCDALSTYHSRFYPNGSLGWISGVHHDRHHAHAHVLLFPETSDRVGLNVSDRAPCNLGVGHTVRVNFRETIAQGYLKALEQNLEMFRAPAIFDREAARLENLQLGAAVRVLHDQRAAQELPTDMQPMAEAMLGTFFEDPNVLTLMNQQIETLRRRDPGAVRNLAFRAMVQKRLAGLVQEHDQSMQVLRSKIEQERAAIDGLLNTPGRYRLIHYVPGGPASSPSGTLSYLREHVGKKPATWQPAWNEIESIIHARLAAYDAELDKRVRRFSDEPFLTEATTKAQQQRAMHACFISRETAIAHIRTNQLPHPTDSISSIDHLTLLSLNQSRHARDARIARAAQEVATANRTATVQELVNAHNRSIVFRRVGGDETPVDPAPLSLPSSRPALPATPNFIEREASRAKIRSLEEMRRDDQELLERLSKALTLEPAPHYLTFA